MSVKRYTGSNTATLSGLYAWLNANKSGTFLENVTITLDGTADGDTSEKLIFTKGDVHVDFQLRECFTSGTAIIAYFYGENDRRARTQITAISGSYNQVYTKEGDAILSEHCLLFGVNINRPGGSGYTSYTYNNCGLAMLTPDEDGNLVFTCVNNITFTDYSVFPNDAKISIARGYRSVNFSLLPYYNNQTTALAETVLYNADEVEKAPYLYLATMSQYESDNHCQQSICTVGDTEYVTNGRWYCEV